MINYKWLQQRTCLVTSLKYFQESEGMGILFKQNGDLHDMVVFWVFIFLINEAEMLFEMVSIYCWLRKKNVYA